MEHRPETMPSHDTMSRRAVLTLLGAGAAGTLLLPAAAAEPRTTPVTGPMTQVGRDRTGPAMAAGLDMCTMALLR
ncbi:hypothetical protein GCM10009809_15110 [Isoptericola hypogeus]|uniref:Uncharacterized protein n=1 Tax=Isoptericola hypogeus TaxID=300179 RepID=A0ABP4VBG5_9MICO